MDDKDMRATGQPCVLGAQMGPIIVRQVIGEKEKQKVLDIHVVVPERKPSIEQIVDVFVKDVDVNSVDVITDKVIVRGEFEIKAIYVACLPDQPVHAVEIKHYKWTQDIDLPGARRGMDAEASVAVEFVDYDVDEWSRAYRYKYHGKCDDKCIDGHAHHHHDEDECDHDEDVCNQAGDMCNQVGDVGNQAEYYADHHHIHCNREFDVSVVLKITAKVMADREVQIGAAAVPTAPKG